MYDDPNDIENGGRGAPISLELPVISATDKTPLLSPYAISPPKNGSLRGEGHHDIFSSLNQWFEETLREMIEKEAYIPPGKHKVALKRTMNVIYFWAVFLAAGQAYIYLKPSRNAIQDSELLDQLPELLKSILTGYACFSTVGGNFFLGLSCLVLQLRELLFIHLDSHAKRQIFLDTSHRKEWKIKQLRLFICMAFAASSTIPWAVLARHDPLVKNKSPLIQYLFAIFSAPICLAPIHLRGLRELDRFIGEKWNSWFKQTDRHIQSSRKGLIAAIENSQQTLLQIADSQEKGGILKTKELLEQLTKLREVGPFEDDQTAVSRFFLTLLNLSEANKLDPSEYVRQLLENELAASSTLTKIKNYFETTSKLDLLKALYLFWGKDWIYQKSTLLILASAVTLALLGYSHEAGTGIAEGQTGTNINDESINSPDFSGFLAWYLFISWAVLTPLGGLCIYSSIAIAKGIVNLGKGILKFITCQDNKEKKLIFDQIIMPGITRLSYAIAAAVFLGSGAMNARLNEKLHAFVQDAGWGKFFDDTTYGLWVSAWTSSAVVNFYYGKDTLMDFLFWLGPKISKPGQTEKEAKEAYQLIENLLKAVKEMPVQQYSSFVRGLLEYGDGLENLLSPDTDAPREPDASGKEPRKGKKEMSRGNPGNGQESDPKSERMQQLIRDSLPKIGFSRGRARGDGDCFFDAVAKTLNEGSVREEYTVASLRRLCSKHAHDLEDRYPSSTMNPTEEDKGNNWIFQELRKDFVLYQNYVMSSGFTAEEARDLKERYKIGDGLAIWGEQAIDGIILCKELGIRIHVIEAHEELLDRPEVTATPILHQLIDAEGVHPIEKLDPNIYREENIIHILVYRNHFDPILRSTTLTDVDEYSDDDEPPREDDKSPSAAEELLTGIFIKHGKLTRPEVVRTVGKDNLPLLSRDPSAVKERYEQTGSRWQDFLHSPVTTLFGTPSRESDEEEIRIIDEEAGEREMTEAKCTIV